MMLQDLQFETGEEAEFKKIAYQSGEIFESSDCKSNYK